MKKDFSDEVYSMLKENNLLSSLTEEEKKDIDLYVQQIFKKLQQISEIKQKKEYYKNIHKVFSKIINEKLDV